MNRTVPNRGAEETQNGFNFATLTNASVRKWRTTHLYVCSIPFPRNTRGAIPARDSATRMEPHAKRIDSSRRVLCGSVHYARARIATAC